MRNFFGVEVKQERTFASSPTPVGEALSASLDTDPVAANMSSWSGTIWSFAGTQQISAIGIR